MADSELKDLIATTTLAATDIMYVVVDPGGGGEADRKIEYEDLLAEIKTDGFPAWTSYTPAWTASGGNPAIGNGTLAGAYLQVGKLVFFRINLTYGTTTTSGSGTWEFGLPVNANATAYGVNGSINFTGYGENSGVAGYSIPGGRMSTAQTKFLIHSGTTGNPFNSTTPFTWATADFLSLSGFYEGA